ncbi:MAG: hypothetical protein H6948_16000 [Zoogloeaceae bacterium]|nr:hypothetical protein [Zoogloeaceae bacterium]
MTDELEPQAAAHVGQLIFAFSRLDFMLALAIRNLLAGQSPASLNPLLERLGFKERLDTLREVVANSQAIDPEAAQQFAVWYEKADRLRTTRNAFVHGRWGVQSRDALFNASTKVGRALIGEAKIYTLAELEAEVALAGQVVSEFHAWHFSNVVSTA